MRLAHLREHGLLLGIVAFAGVLRYATLDRQSFWFDEAFTVMLVRLPLDGMLSEIPETESTPPLYYLVAWVWSRIFGTGEVGLRSLSALLGTATVPVMYVAGKELISRPAGLITAALVAASPFLVWYSQEARSYPLLLFLSALSLATFARVLSDPVPRNALWWAICCGLAIATHYFAVFLVAAEAVILLVRARARRGVLAATGLVLVTGLALLPLAVYQERGGRVRHIEATDFGLRIRDLIQQFLAGNYAVPHATYVGTLALAAAIVLALVLTVGEERRGVAAIVLLAVGGIGLPLGLALGGLDYFAARNLLAAWLPIALVFGAALGARRAGLAGLTAVTAICTMLLAATIEVLSTPRLQRDDWRAAARAIGPPESDRALVVLGFGMLALQLYRPSAEPVTEGTVRVRELSVLTRQYPYTTSFGRLPSSFRMIQARQIQHLILVRFRSPLARRVGVNAIEAAFPGFRPVAIAIELP